VTHRQSTRLHTIQSVTLQPAEEIFFVMDSKDGTGDQRVSVVQYFKNMYAVEVTKPRLPCIQVSQALADRSVEAHTSQYGKKSFIPLEFVHLADWNPLPPTKLSADQTAE
jgi:eukaryotic translation initiation factor 2C